MHLFTFSLIKCSKKFAIYVLNSKNQELIRIHLLHNSSHYSIFYVIKWNILTKWNKTFLARFSSFFFFFLNVKKILSVWLSPLKKCILYLYIKKIQINQINSPESNHQNNVWNLYKDNNKDIRITSITVGFKLWYIYERHLFFLCDIYIIPSWYLSVQS